MKRLASYLAFIFISTILISVPSMAIPTPDWSDNGNALDAVLDSFSVNPDNTSVDVKNDYLASDSYWTIQASGGSIHSVILGFMGEVENKSFGIFSPDSDNDNNIEMVQVFNGSSGAGTLSVLSILSDGSVYLNFGDTGVDFLGNYFGYYIESGGNIWYSDSSLNSDLQDHMVAYQGNGIDIVQVPGHIPGIWTTSSYLFGFEEDSLPGDYADFVFVAESISPVTIPVPGALLLVLIGVGSLKIRKIA